ncbi:MAG: alginate lyase family protein [Verrucomicrobiaceae bacterium]
MTISLLKKVALLTLGILSAHADFVHPGVFHSREGIDFVKSKIAAKEEPWLNAWNELRESRYANPGWKPKAFPKVERGPYNDPDVGSTEFTDDGRAAYTHALRWVLAGEEASARKSAEILNAWSGTLKAVTDHDARLLVGMSGQTYLIAAELLRHYKGGWKGWTPDQQAQFEDMLRNVWYPVIKPFHPTANGNWDAAMLQTMISIGVFLDDQAIFDRAVNHYLNGESNGAIGMYFKPSGQCQESGRDQAHTQMGLEFLANTAETAWIQGVDLYGALDNRLLKGFEYTAKFNLGHDVSYEPYRSFEGRYHYKSISEKARGRLHNIYEKVNNHYHHRRGLDAPFTQKALQKTRPESRRRCFVPWSTLMFYGQSFPAPSPGK